MEEEVWNDINLSSLYDRSATASDETLRAALLQDFFTKPSLSTKLDPQTTNDSLSFGHSISLSPSPKRPATLTCESDSGFRLLETRAPVKSNPVPESRPGLLTSLNSALCSPVQNKKRAQGINNGDDLADRKYQRLMKNRESAARSRARKQAYTNELEFEVAHLKKENAKLEKQLRQFYLKEAPAQLPKKRTLYRTLTAPF